MGDIIIEAFKFMGFLCVISSLLFVVSVFFVTDIMIRMAAKYRRKYQAAPADCDENASVSPTKDFGIEKIWLDNPLFLLFRKWGCQLDNALFNRNEAAGPNYRPTRFVLVLPFWSGLISALFFLLANAFYNQDNTVYFIKDFVFCFYVFVLLPTVIINMFFTCGNVFVIRGWIRKVLYPVFLIACSATTCLLIFWGLLLIRGIVSPDHIILKHFPEIMFRI